MTSSKKKLAHRVAEQRSSNPAAAFDPLTLLVTEFAQIHGLSGRERDVCVLLSRGMSEKMIGDALALGSHTAEVYLRRAYQKVGVNSRNDLRHAIVNFAADSWHEERTRSSDAVAPMMDSAGDLPDVSKCSARSGTPKDPEAPPVGSSAKTRR